MTATGQNLNLMSIDRRDGRLPCGSALPRVVVGTARRPMRLNGVAATPGSRATHAYADLPDEYLTGVGHAVTSLDGELGGTARAESTRADGGPEDPQLELSHSGCTWFGTWKAGRAGALLRSPRPSRDCRSVTSWGGEISACRGSRRCARRVPGVALDGWLAVAAVGGDLDPGLELHRRGTPITATGPARRGG